MGDDHKNDDFYAVLGLKKECTVTELRNAYKKLAMKWHPDRCSASRDQKYVDEAKKKFQAVQHAYSVLSDANKRFLYDVGVYDCDDDDDANGMGDFLNEMATMMSQNKSSENRNETFEELQELFEEIFCSDEAEVFGSSSRSTTPPSRLSSQDSCNESCSISNKRNSCDMSSSNNFRIETNSFEGFCIGMGEHRENIESRRAVEERTERWGEGSKSYGKKRKIFSNQDISSNEYSRMSA